MDDGGPSSPASYIRLVQHLIEKCICYYMNKEECMETLEKHANIKPVITSTVWKELEKENQEFFETYQKDRGEESTHKNPSDGQPSASKSSSDEDDDHHHHHDDDSNDDGNNQKDRGEESKNKNPSDAQLLLPRAHQTTTATTITTTMAARTLARPTPASVTLARPTPSSVRSRSSSDDRDDHGDNNNDGN